MVLRLLGVFTALFLLLSLIGAGGVMYVFYTFGSGLPDYHQLNDYEPPVMTRIHAGDGRLLAEYAIEKRVFVPITAIPRRVARAFLAAEDQHFYDHMGVDPIGVARAMVTNLRNIGSGRRLQGASTITQQVAKNFLLTNEVSYRRKIQEAILALRIEKVLTKDRILELYLNEIYLGYGSYGVAAASLNYFNKSLGELTVAEAAYLAALPKAPNNYDPIRKRDAAVERRNWVIGRMFEEGFVDAVQRDQALSEPLIVRERSETEFVTAEYFAEEVRRELADRYGEDGLYKGGLSVRTTIDPNLQNMAQKSLRDGLIAYDRRHGYRGPVARIAADGAQSLPADWLAKLRETAVPKGLPKTWFLAAVDKASNDSAEILFSDASKGTIPLAELRWAREALKDQKRGPSIKRARDVLKAGDVVLVEAVTERKNSKGEATSYPEGTYALRQMPEIQGSLVALDPHTGRVLAMVGGFSYQQSEFNRATQAKRQPGSAFKPFVYLAGMDQGFTPSSIVLDAPFVIDQGPGLPKWRPANYTKKFYGPSTLRLGIEKSRNLMTVRLAQELGMERIADYSGRLGIYDRLPERLAMSLGAGETTLLRLTTAYAMLVNGGKTIRPSLIDRIQDRNGRTVFRHDDRPCPDCDAMRWTRQAVPRVPDTRTPVTSPASAYQVVSMLEGVVKRGTGRRIASLNRPLAGKTGTTNSSLDTWFVGFSPDLAVGVFMGFDEPRSLGRKETGSSVAAPVFKSFMGAALKDQPTIPFRIPDGIRLVRINARTGKLARDSDSNVILEAFKPGTVPTAQSEAEEMDSRTYGGSGAPALGTGGLY
ncbi:penicillin-binding protein 1A [Magnetospira sp. QH-2]|uniref:penicillin-binding protein 1A n=1 Tax=Magnetospira sp. (strain QH-2) TaxID=1288970 RepID=UPI0003E812F0|nr:penicillin-binding protein 1A [Magnetospira sp. QH-2]CCQ74334.1 GT51 : candidate bifunctional family GT51 b-glycosyltransferase/PBP transpeptidase (candidate murein polymerase) [Magnetospira sp. QH-2]